MLISLVCISQESDVFKMKKDETSNKNIDRILQSDTIIDLKFLCDPITSLSISGNIKLLDQSSLLRIILVTADHEYLVYETNILLSEKIDFSFNKVCDESDLINEEIPKKLIVIVRNAEFLFTKIYFSNIKLHKHEQKNLLTLRKEQKRKVEKFKAEKINHFNREHQKTWSADTSQIALLPFEKKKLFYGDSYDYETSGFE
ncbi:MAG: hypothetical protein ACERKD_01555 [Prolixibacteraceae bacterium]